ncbi:hypothetical protein QQ045_003754 [Rhodiola kirilowii]
MTTPKSRNKAPKTPKPPCMKVLGTPSRPPSRDMTSALRTLIGFWHIGFVKTHSSPNQEKTSTHLGIDEAHYDKAQDVDKDVRYSNSKASHQYRAVTCASMGSRYSFDSKVKE